ncbi:abrin-c isoform X1 [Abrus precatorius]|uniref:Ribosome-inactivating protein n=1 Tax=Abrus precatorius TaxID=3816 RepID=A0A8B8L607_ABRPR|nr:abrin-c precursor [Abrus precatorius]XP_027351635.1 abrin-c isoform X1 [Abrus precatorius]
MDKTLKLLILCLAWTCSFSALRCAARTNPPGATNQDRPIKFTTEGATSQSYKQFIEALRERLRGGLIHDIPVLRDPTTVDERNRYITVELSNSERESIEVGIDVTNAYVVAYRAGSQSYFLRDAPASASTYLFTGTQRYSLRFDGSYGDLERWAHQTREQISLGLQALTHAISFLRSGASNDEEKARTLIVIIQMVAEAARYRYISNRVGVSIRTGTAFQPDPAMLSLENNWDNLSRGVQESVQDTFPNAVTLRRVNNQPVIVDSLTHQSVAVLALMLFVCNPPNTNQSPLLIRSIVEESKICSSRYEPTVRIGGRDGMCVDVYDDGYHNGNRIILFKCKDRLEENQLWTLKSDKTIRSNGKCLTTEGYAPGNYVMIYDCTSAVPEATYWEIWDNGTIINPKSALVLSAESSSMEGTLTVQTNEYLMGQGWRTGNNTSPFVTSISGYSDLCMQAQGSNVWLADCDNNKKEQQWALYTDGSIRSVQNTNNCLTSKDHKQGSPIVLMACSNGWASQRWLFKNDGSIYNLHDDMVMDVKRSDPSLKEIILHPYHGKANQIWLTLF